jgi:hypothetical protein
VRPRAGGAAFRGARPEEVIPGFEEKERFVREVKAVSPRTRVVVPRHFETLALERPGKAVS